jgi:hypothetical protein
MQAGHKYLNWRMLAQLSRDRAGFLSNFGEQRTRSAHFRELEKSIWRMFLARLR